MTDPQEVLEAIREADPTASGDLEVESSGIAPFVVVRGELTSSKFDSLDELAAASSTLEPAMLNEVTLKRPTLTVKGETRVGVELNGDPERIPTSRVVDVSLRLLPETENGTMKRKNPEALNKLKRVVEKTGFIAPVILTDSYEVIDGALRIEAARQLKLRSVPAVVLPVDETLASFLRLVLNRSSEFQRWDFTQVDAFANENLGMTGYLEPFGIFSDNIIPVTFFGDTVKNYEISEHNDQQKYYAQSIGLAEWAKMVRAGEAGPKTDKPAKTKKVTTKTATPAFALDFMTEGSEPDPAETPAVVAEDERVRTRENAGEITEAYDEFRGEASKIQNARRSPKTKTQDNKAAALLAAQNGEEDSDD